MNPIERAARALASLASGGVCHPSDPDIEWQGWVPEARAAFESIDVEDMANVLDKAHHPEDDVIGWDDFRDYAVTIKHYLLGGNQ